MKMKNENWQLYRQNCQFQGRTKRVQHERDCSANFLKDRF